MSDPNCKGCKGTGWIQTGTPGERVPCDCGGALTSNELVDAACEYFGALSARVDRGDRTVDLPMLIEHAAALVTQIGRLERATPETRARRCGWFGEGRGHCLLDERHETHIQTRHHVCEQDGRLLDVALTGLAAVREAQRRSEKADNLYGGKVRLACGCIDICTNQRDHEPPTQKAVAAPCGCLPQRGESCPNCSGVDNG